MKIHGCALAALWVLLVRFAVEDSKCSYPKGDTNGDCQVNFTDIAKLIYLGNIRISYSWMSLYAIKRKGDFACYVR